MSSSEKVSVDELSDAIVNALQGYSQDVADAAKDAAKEAIDYAVDELRATSPGGGDYAKDWASKVLYEDSQGIRIAAYNRRHYQLTHLLENGHVSKNQYGTYGTVRAYPHIAKVQEQVAEQFESKVKLKIGKHF